MAATGMNTDRILKIRTAPVFHGEFSLAREHRIKGARSRLQLPVPVSVRPMCAVCSGNSGCSRCSEGPQNAANIGVFGWLGD